LEPALAEFRGAVREWSAALEPARATDFRRRQWATRLRIAAAAGLAMALLAVPVYQKARHDRERAIELAKQDDALLKQIDADLSRRTPVAMEPLMELVSFPSGTKEKQ
jgi:hypothetical protein